MEDSHVDMKLLQTCEKKVRERPQKTKGGFKFVNFVRAVEQKRGGGRWKKDDFFKVPAATGRWISSQWP